MLQVGPIECPKPAKIVGTAGLGSRQSLLPPGEDVPEPLPGSFEVLLMFVKTNQETKNGGGRGLEWAVVG